MYILGTKMIKKVMNIFCSSRLDLEGKILFYKL